LKKVFECPIEKKPEIAKLLEADPYGEKSFSRNGYKLKDGTILGEDAKTAYLYLSATDEFMKWAEEKLKGLVAESKPEVSARIIKKIEDEESGAEAGFGAIFG
jgi:hypothetical protein